MQGFTYDVFVAVASVAAAAIAVFTTIISLALYQTADADPPDSPASAAGSRTDAALDRAA
jgi:mannose/fructose/N-acetylgalactosamine-specific phosphotransferase system component IIC